MWPISLTESLTSLSLRVTASSKWSKMEYLVILFYSFLGTGVELGLQREHLIEIVLAIEWNGYYV